MPDWLLWLLIAVVLLAVLVWQVAAGLRRFRRQRLLERFGDPVMVDTILQGKLAQGMTAEMVKASWGEPADFEESVMKTKVKHEMKYDPKGRNRFGARVYLENGVVVGWDVK